MPNTKADKTTKCPLCGQVKRDDHSKCYDCHCVEIVSIKGMNASQHEIDHAVKHAEDKPFILRKQFGMCPCDDENFGEFDDED